MGYGSSDEQEDNPLNSIIENLKELQKDSSVPRNVKTKISNTLVILAEDCELSIRINKALSELEEVADDSNMEPFTRTQIWNIVSALEMF